MFGEFRPGGVEREWCDTNVLRILRRRSLAALRHEIEPVDASTYARFLCAWHSVGRGRRGTDALVEALEQLQGVAIPASVLERDVLPARVDGYRPDMLDELCAAGELVWIGAGALGADDGRVRVFFRDRVRLLATRPALEGAPDGEIHDAIRDRLLRAGASFWPDLVAATGIADDNVVLTALWDLVWAGEITNDTFGPLRSAPSAPRRTSGRGRPHPGRLTRLGPPAGAGRWSLVVPLLEPEPSPTERSHASALQLLERQGVVTREAVRAEGASGGFAGVYPVLRALEESGRARRGWFVAGLGAAQFALPGAVDRLRAHRTIDDESRSRVLVVAATDPAQPYGAALSWPERTGNLGASVPIGRRLRRPGRRRMRRLPRTRRQGARHLRHLDDRSLGRSARRGAQAGALVAGPDRAHRRRAGTHSPHAAALRAAGFADGYKGLTLR